MLRYIEFLSFTATSNLFFFPIAVFAKMKLKIWFGLMSFLCGLFFIFTEAGFFHFVCIVFKKANTEGLQEALHVATLE